MKPRFTLLPGRTSLLQAGGNALTLQTEIVEKEQGFFLLFSVFSSGRLISQRSQPLGSADFEEEPNQLVWNFHSQLEKEVQKRLKPTRALESDPQKQLSGKAPESGKSCVEQPSEKGTQPDQAAPEKKSVEQAVGKAIQEGGPETADGWCDRGFQAYAEEKFEEALECWQEYLELDPEDSFVINLTKNLQERLRDGGQSPSK